jgi:apolipoprotein N-acyltransferase
MASRLARILILAAAMASTEWLRGHVLTGFWNAFATCCPLAGDDAERALVGLWGLTLAAFIIFAAPAALLPRTSAGTWRGRGFALFALALLAAHAGYGAIRLATATDGGSGGPALRIVQPSLDQSERWQADNEDEIVARYLRLSAEPGLMASACRPARSDLAGIGFPPPQRAARRPVGDRRPPARGQHAAHRRGARGKPRAAMPSTACC